MPRQKNGAVVGAAPPMLTEPRDYLQKWKGADQAVPATRASPSEIVWSLIGSFIGMATVAWLNARYFEAVDLPLLIGSYGASAVLLYAAPQSPLAQPRQVLGGHFISATAGVACFVALGDTPWLAQAAAVSLAIGAMHLTGTLHPPGGATALIAVIGSPSIHALGFRYVLLPGLVGPVVLLLIALVVNNVALHRRYPTTWR